MSGNFIGTAGILFFLLLVLLGMPIAFSFATVGIVGMIILKGTGSALSLLGAAPYMYTASWGFVCIPLFVLMGQFAYNAGISKDLYKSAYKWLGRFPGGLVLATVLACAGFAACTGSSIASAATMSTLAYPEMKKFKYDDRWATGAIAAGGTLGPLIPPSVLFIVYGVISGTSVAQLFIAGILPGLLIAALFLVAIGVMFKIRPELGPSGQSFSWKERLISLKSVWGMMALFLLVVGGLYFGLVTPSEAGALGAFGAFAIMVIRRQLTKYTFFRTFKETLHITCFIMTVLIGAMIFSTFLVVTGLPSSLAEALAGLPLSKYVILVVILLAYIPLGCIIDSLPMILLTLPIVCPVIQTLGFDMIWFGVMVVVLCEVSLVTPPVGMNLYIVQGVTKIPLEIIARGIIPFLLMLFIGLAILVVFPSISLLLPNMMR